MFLKKGTTFLFFKIMFTFLKTSFLFLKMETYFWFQKCLFEKTFSIKILNTSFKFFRFDHFVYLNPLMKIQSNFYIFKGE